MKMLRYGLAAGAGLLAISYVAIAYAGMWPGFPIVGAASYCSGSASSAIGSIIGAVTGCPNTVPAGPSVVTGTYTIPADTNTPGGAAPQTVLLSLGSLNSLPISVQAVTTGATAATAVSASNTSGGQLYTASITITSANITLPPTPIDGQQFRIASNRTITTLSVQAGGTASMGGNTAPTTLSPLLNAASDYLFRYNAADTSWYRLQ